MRTVAALCRELLPDRRTDGALLAAFTSERDEATFLELVRRHGPLVWGVCRRVLPDPADAEDAFQATFLVLVSQATKLATRDAVGPWLHRVAVWTSRNVRRKNARRLARQRELPEGAPTALPDSDLKADIDGALLSLPARYREPIILCHLQGFTRREAAERLGCAEGTLSAWLNRGLAKLRIRLRALDPAQVLGTAVIAVPAALTASTARAAVASGVAAATVPPAVSSLVEGVLHMLWIKKATAAAFALCAVFGVGVGVGLGTRPGSNGATAQDGPPATETTATAKAAPLAPPASDDKLVEEVTAQLQRAEKQLALHKSLLQLTSDKLVLMRQVNPTSKPSAAELEELRQLEAGVAARTAEFEALKVYLARQKANKPAAAAPAGDKEPALRKLEERLKADKPAGNKESAQPKLEDLKAQLAKIEAERAKLLAQADATKKQLLDAELRLRELQRTAELLAAQAELDKLAKRVATGAGYLELNISSKGEFTIREVPPTDGKQRGQARVLGPITTADPVALAVLITRAKNDPNGPREVRILVSGSSPKELLRAATDACKSAGITSVTAEITEPPASNPNRDKKPSPASGTTGPVGDAKEEFQKLERYRKSLDEDLQELRKQREEELRELRERYKREPQRPQP